MKIVLAIHDSACSRATLVSLAERPWPTATEIVVLSVVPVMPGVFLAADWHAGDLIASIEAQKILFDTHKQLVAESATWLRRRLPQCRVFENIQEGDVHDCIVETARNGHADFIFLGSHMRRGISRFLFGDIAEAVLSNAPCSVEIIRMKNKLPRRVG